MFRHIHVENTPYQYVLEIEKVSVMLYSVFSPVPNSESPYIVNYYVPRSNS